MKKILAVLLVLVLCCNGMGEEPVKESYLPYGMTFHASYVYPTTAEVSLFDIRSGTEADAFHIGNLFDVYFGFDPLHVSIDPNKVSDEALFSLGGALVMGLIVGAFDGYSPSNEVLEVLGYILLGVPVYAWCGNLYIPLVPKSWLGLTDQSHIITHVIYERGFHLRSFTYVNDIGLRWSPMRTVYFDYFEAGVRLEKNFADDFKCKFFFQIGGAGTSK